MTHLTQRKRILELLQRKDFVPTAVLVREGFFQYNSRIFELRKQGWEIRARKLGVLHGFELIGSRLHS